MSQNKQSSYKGRVNKKSSQIQDCNEVQHLQVQHSKAEDFTPRFPLMSRTEVANDVANSASVSYALERQDKKTADCQRIMSESMSRQINTEDLLYTKQTNGVSGAVRSDNGLKQSVFLCVDRSFNMPGQSLMKTPCPPDRNLQDINVNKQQMCMSEQMKTFFPHTSETTMKLKNTQSAFQQYSTLKANESQLAHNMQYFDNRSARSPVPIGQFIDDSNVSPSSMEKERNEKNVHDSPFVDLGNSQEIPQNIDISLNDLSRGVGQLVRTQAEVTPGVLSDGDSAKNELTTSFPKSCYEIIPSEPDVVYPTPIGNGEDGTGDKLIQHSQKTVHEMFIDSAKTKHGSLPEGDDGVVPCTGDGNITIHQPFPGVDRDSSQTDHLLGTDQNAAQKVFFEPSYEMSFDDSVFPTNHRLATSEDMRAAMMQARKKSYYRRPDNAVFDVTMRYGFATDDGLMSSFKRLPFTTRGDLQLKYRQIVSAMNRQAFDAWKAETSARNGQEQELEEPEIATHSLREKFIPLGCPKCLQNNMSYIYGKPCPCRKLSKDRALDHCGSHKPSGKTGPRLSSSNKNDWWRSNNVAASFRNQPQLSNTGRVYHCPSFGDDREGTAGRNLVKTGLMSDTVSKSLSQSSRASATIKVDMLPTDTSRVFQDPESANGGKEQRQSNTGLTKFSSNHTTSFSKKGSKMEDLIILNPPERKSGPLREWEISKLENTLKNCISKKYRTCSSPDFSLNEIGEFWSSH